MPRPDLRAGAQSPFLRDRSGLYRPSAGFYPLSSLGLSSLAGITPTSVYALDEASGNLTDRAGSVNLAVAGTPTYGHTAVNGVRRGILFDAADDAFTADVHALGLASGIYACVTSISAHEAATKSLIGRYAADRHVFVRTFVGGLIRLTIHDGTSTAHVVPTGDPAFSVNVPYLVQAQIDRAASLARLRMSGLNGQVLDGSVSIAGYGTLSGGTSPVFFVGGIPTVMPGSLHCVSYAFVATGTQCEGASKLKQIAVALGWE